MRVIAKNKKALFEFAIEEKFEAGIILTGSEVKSARQGKLALTETYAAVDKTSIAVLLYNCHIATYEQAGRFNHNPTRPRKLLLHKRQIKKIVSKTKIKGYTLIALSAYFNQKNLLKIELGLARGKKLHDKRQSIKDQDWQRQQARTLRGNKYD